MVGNSVWRCLVGGVAAIGILFAQPPGGGPLPGPPPPPRDAAPIDLTGYWVSLVTEDWRERMTVPPKGAAESIPLNAEGRKAAQAWDPAKDESDGNQCKSYGVGGIVRMPGRLHITWQDDNTLKIEFDAGTQTRILHFRAPQGTGGDWQGVSVANWDVPGTIMARGGFAFARPGGPDRGGALRVVTTKMKAGYLRRNGIPYTENAVLTEYFDRFNLPNGDALLLITSELADPAYLTNPYWTSTHFKKQADGTGWNPTPCSAR